MDFSDATLTEGHVFIALVCTCGIVFMIGLWSRAQTNRICDCLDAIEENLRTTASAAAALSSHVIGLPYTKDGEVKLLCFTLQSQKTVGELLQLSEAEKVELRGILNYWAPPLEERICIEVLFNSPIGYYPVGIWYLELVKRNDPTICRVLQQQVATSDGRCDDGEQQALTQHDQADPEPDQADQAHEKAE